MLNLFQIRIDNLATKIVPSNDISMLEDALQRSESQKQAVVEIDILTIAGASVV